MKCKYCNTPAGFLKTKHKECEKQHNITIKNISDIVFNSIMEKNQIYIDIEEYIKTISISGYVKYDKVEKIIEEQVKSILKENIYEKSDIIELFINSLPSNIKEKILNSDEYCNFWKTEFVSYLSTLSGSKEIDEEHSKSIQMLQNKNISKLSNEMQNIFLNELSNRINIILEDGIIEPQEEYNLCNYLSTTKLKDTDILHKNKSFELLIQSLVLRDIQEGKIPERCNVEDLPIILGKNEYLIWVYKNINAYEQKTGKRYIGKSNGIKMRVCKGVYYSVGASKGYSIDYDYQNELGKGILIITNKNIIFVGLKSIKIPISKIISYIPYNDGIEITKDATTPKIYTFAGDNPWFIINAIQVLV